MHSRLRTLADRIALPDGYHSSNNTKVWWIQGCPCAAGSRLRRLCEVEAPSILPLNTIYATPDDCLPLAVDRLLSFVSRRRARISRHPTVRTTFAYHGSAQHSMAIHTHMGYSRKHFAAGFRTTYMLCIQSSWNVFLTPFVFYDHSLPVMNRQSQGRVRAYRRADVRVYVWTLQATHSAMYVQRADDSRAWRVQAERWCACGEGRPGGCQVSDQDYLVDGGSDDSSGCGGGEQVTM